MVYIIGGGHRSGKNTVAEIIAKHVERPVITGFSHPLKEMTRKLRETELGKTFIPEGEYGEGEKSEMERKWLEFLGTDIVRDNVVKDFWANKLLTRVVLWGMEGMTPIICDCRFENEWRISLGHKTRIWVTRPSIQKRNHKSESFKPVDGIHIINDGTLEDLTNKVKEIL